MFNCTNNYCRYSTKSESHKLAYPYFCERWLIFFFSVRKHHLLLLSHYCETCRCHSIIWSVSVSVLQCQAAFYICVLVNPFPPPPPLPCCMTFCVHNGRKLIHMYVPYAESPWKRNAKAYYLTRKIPVPQTENVENNSYLNIYIFRGKNVRYFSA